MTRKELIESDEYIQVTLECEIRCGKSVKKMREDIAKLWIRHRDELLDRIEFNEVTREWDKRKIA